MGCVRRRAWQSSWRDRCGWADRQKAAYLVTLQSLKADATQTRLAFAQFPFVLTHAELICSGHFGEGWVGEKASEPAGWGRKMINGGSEGERERMRMLSAILAQSTGPWAEPLIPLDSYALRGVFRRNRILSPFVLCLYNMWSALYCSSVITSPFSCSVSLPFLGSSVAAAFRDLPLIFHAYRLKDRRRCKNDPPPLSLMSSYTNDLPLSTFISWLTTGVPFDPNVHLLCDPHKPVRLSDRSVVNLGASQFLVLRSPVRFELICMFSHIRFLTHGVCRSPHLTGESSE